MIDSVLVYIMIHSKKIAQPVLGTALLYNYYIIKVLSYASIAATPGRTLPSIASSRAPPPVEM